MGSALIGNEKSEVDVVTSELLTARLFIWHGNNQSADPESTFLYEGS